MHTYYAIRMWGRRPKGLEAYTHIIYSQPQAGAIRFEARSIAEACYRFQEGVAVSAHKARWIRYRKAYRAWKGGAK